MRRWWLYYLPLLFLPNLGNTQSTDYGVLEFADMLIVPYIILVSMAADFRRRTLIDRIVPWMIGFIVWALLSTLLINARYDYPDLYHTWFGSLKLGKFLLYGLASYLTSKALVDESVRRQFAWSIVGAALVVGVGLIFVGQKSAANEALVNGSIRGYKASNGISVTAAIFACYLSGFWPLTKSIGPRFRRIVPVILLILFLGAGISEGRGGWVAGFLGLLYFAVKRGLEMKTILLMAAALLSIFAAYSTIPVFRKRVDTTLHPTGDTLALASTAGIDNGGRPAEWAGAIERFREPVFGTGFFHRGALTGTEATGSHNFYLQMLLETGFPGAFMVLGIFVMLWRQAGMLAARRLGLALPTKAALIAGFAGGMSGEYYYGGVALLALLLTQAACGSLSSLEDETVLPFIAPLRSPVPGGMASR